MPSWKKVITSGSKADLLNITSSGGIRSDYIEHTAGRFYNKKRIKTNN